MPPTTEYGNVHQQLTYGLWFFIPHGVRHEMTLVVEVPWNSIPFHSIPFIPHGTPEESFPHRKTDHHDMTLDV